jgi:indole-3-glycerol phosphate synthase
LQVDVEASHRLARRIPAGVVAVSESGLGSRSDLDALIPDGYRAFLIGERFMIDPDPRRAIAELTAFRHGTGARATA